VACKLRGGIRYAGQPIARAGTSMAALRRQAGHARRNGQVSPGRDLALITPYENGPLIVRGSFMITAQDGTPIPAGRKTVALCRCGQSALKPFCDGSHTRTGFRACGGEDVLRRPRASAGDD
jgi:CDGSH-type Zn-finger protein